MQIEIVAKLQLLASAQYRKSYHILTMTPVDAIQLMDAYGWPPQYHDRIFTWVCHHSGKDLDRKRAFITVDKSYFLNFLSFYGPQF